MRIALILFFWCVPIVNAQTAIPFGSSKNTIELTIQNTSLVSVANMKVIASKMPGWLQMPTKELTLPAFDAQQSRIATFSFDVDKSAPVNVTDHVVFNIVSPAGEMWTKSLAISVLPPDHFELFQNYPNPFNPSTTISYQLPSAGYVSISVYNSIGQLVTTLINGEQKAGYHQEQWNASNVASGMYIYQLALVNNHGNTEFYRKKMVVVK